MSASPAVGVEDLAVWRARLYARLVGVLMWAGWLVGVPSVMLAVHEQLWPLVVADGLALMGVSVLYRRRFTDSAVGSAQLLALMYLLGVALLVTVGHVAQIYLMALPVLAVLLLSVRAALACLILNAVTLLTMGLLLHLDAGTAFLAGQPLWRWVAITFNFLLIDAALTAACAFLLQGMERALSEQRRHFEQLTHQAMHDALTGLANRRLLQDRVGLALTKAARAQTQVGVLVLDLDHFKNVNDRHGHEWGDSLISAVSTRLQRAVRAGDTVARLGGDEFVVLLAEVGSEAEMLAAVERVLSCVNGQYPLGDQTLFVSASVGVAIYPRDGTDAISLLKNADTALYRAKEGGRNQFQFFESAMNERLVARMELEAALRVALERGELVLYYQPRISSHDGACRSAEALIRWQHPQWGLVSPLRFIPVAEDTGLIVPIGAWVLRTAAAQLAKWQKLYPQLRLSVNLSAREFHDKLLLSHIQEAVALVGTGSLELEVTESLVMDDVTSAQRLLCAIRDLQVGVALDDFGTGFSSLAYLKAFALDVLKIDQSFIRGLESARQDRAIVKTIVDLAENLCLSTVAEGVETPTQAQVLQSMGVDELQGYLYARPMPAADFADWLATHYRAPLIGSGARAGALAPASAQPVHIMA